MSNQAAWAQWISAPASSPPLRQLHGEWAAGALRGFWSGCIPWLEMHRDLLDLCVGGGKIISTLGWIACACLLAVWRLFLGDFQVSDFLMSRCHLEDT